MLPSVAEQILVNRIGVLLVFTEFIVSVPIKTCCRGARLEGLDITPESCGLIFRLRAIFDRGDIAYPAHLAIRFLLYSCFLYNSPIANRPFSKPRNVFRVPQYKQKTSTFEFFRLAGSTICHRSSIYVFFFWSTRLSSDDKSLLAFHHRIMTVHFLFRGTIWWDFFATVCDLQSAPSGLSLVQLLIGISPMDLSPDVFNQNAIPSLRKCLLSHFGKVVHIPSSPL